MKTLKQQTDEKISQGRKKNPTFMEGVDKLIEEAKEFQIGKNALRVGDTAPMFTLPNQVQSLVSLDAILSSGPIIITFYRGSWCPYCNLQLRAIQKNLEEIHRLGAKLVAISPEVPDNSLEPSEISKMNFTVLSDQDANVAKQYGVSWEVPKLLIDHMKNDRNLELAVINNGNGTTLPIPATFIINTNGKIIWSDIHIDYRTRSEPSDIIEFLKGIQ